MTTYSPACSIRINKLLETNIIALSSAESISVIKKLYSLLTDADRKVFQDEWSRHAAAISPSEGINSVQSASGWADVMVFEFAKRFLETDN